MTPEEIEYISQLSIKEKQALEIAMQHLESSFSLKKTNGFVEYMNNKKKELTKKEGL